MTSIPAPSVIPIPLSPYAGIDPAPPDGAAAASGAQPPPDHVAAAWPAPNVSAGGIDVGGGPFFDVVNALIDQLGALIGSLIGAAGSPGPAVPPAPQPIGIAGPPPAENPILREPTGLQANPVRTPSDPAS